MSARVLVVDDDTDLAEMLGIVLRSEGMDPVFCHDGAEARAHVPPRVARPGPARPHAPRARRPEVCRLLRSESTVPIVMLTARGDTLDIVEGLQAGADDYIVKPFKPKELVARIAARLRRLGADRERGARIGEVVIDIGAHSVTRGGAPIAVTPLEFDLLAALAARPGLAFTREQLLADVWGYRHVGGHPTGQRPRAAAAREGRAWTRRTRR